jgi:hypothetical protein
MSGSVKQYCKTCGATSHNEKPKTSPTKTDMIEVESCEKRTRQTKTDMGREGLGKLNGPAM